MRLATKAMVPPRVYTAQLVVAAAGPLSPDTPPLAAPTGATLVHSVARHLKQLAQRHSLAALVSNHVTSAGVQAAQAQAQALLQHDQAAAGALGGVKPAVGEHWRAQPAFRVQLLGSDLGAAPGGPHRCAVLTASTLEVPMDARGGAHRQ